MMKILFFGLCWLSATIALAAPPQVVVSIKPLHSLAANVMAGIGEPALLLEANRSPHNFSLKPSDRRLLEQADLLVWVGREMERPLLKVIEAAGKGAGQLELLRQPTIREFMPKAEPEPEPEPGHDHGHEHEHAQHTGLDPHIWLSPEMAKGITGLLATELARLDPANAPRYQANAADTLERLNRLDQDLGVRLEPLRGKPYLVYHAAYGWFERHYGLGPTTALTLNPERQLGAASVQRLRQQASAQGMQCIFNEPQFSPKLAQRLAEDLGLRQGVLDPLGAELVAGKEAYFALLENLTDALVGCLKP
ncbi:MAG: zinc ABC transporter substrate-binding protein [Gammaproteobacteria bacterium SHHR-1]